MEGEHVETLAGVVPVRRRKFLGSTKDNVERVWARELAMEGVMSCVSRDGIPSIGGCARSLYVVIHMIVVSTGGLSDA